jgi:hypothetical protein
MMCSRAAAAEGGAETTAVIRVVAVEEGGSRRRRTLVDLRDGEVGRRKRRTKGGKAREGAERESDGGSRDPIFPSPVARRTDACFALPRSSRECEDGKGKGKKEGSLLPA